MKSTQARKAIAYTFLAGMILEPSSAKAIAKEIQPEGNKKWFHQLNHKPSTANRNIEMLEPSLLGKLNVQFWSRWTHSQRTLQQTCDQSALDKQPIIVAVIDTGVDARHQVIRPNLWTNPGESGLDELGRDKSSNNVDDDNNGYIDDIHGWNFVTGDKDIKDRHGHGTHIAGIILREQAIEKKYQRPCSSTIKIMVLKYFDPLDTNEQNMSNTVQAIRYATRMGARIINYSAGGPTRNYSEEKAIRFALAKNILFVAAAGNENQNSDLAGFYPASYRLENIISVTALDRDSHFLSGSNYGSQSVHLAAPGKDIISTLPNNQYGAMSGTSQATAFVSRIAAQLMATTPYLTEPSEIKNQLLKFGVRDRRLAGKTRYQVRLRETQVYAGTKAKDEPLAFFVPQ